MVSDPISTTSFSGALALVINRVQFEQLVSMRVECLAFAMTCRSH
jgi:hypothetical protein